MSDLYQQQRSGMIIMRPGLSWLPEQPPASPVVPLCGASDWQRLLGPALATHASSVLLLGWGDGEAFWRLLADPVGRVKIIYLVIFEGERDAFAAALAKPFFARIAEVALAIGVCTEPSDVLRMMNDWFPTHRDVPRLAGIDIVSGHPLCVRAEAQRAQWQELIETAFLDRPQAYGNDIVDSWTGISQASANARMLLSAPSIGEMTGFFGQRPVISIAAGPSVRRHLDALRRLQDRCVLVCCDAVLHGLIDAGIFPHFVTPLERVDMVRPMLTRAAESPRTIYAGLPVVVPDVVQRFAGRAIGVMCGDALYDWLDPDCQMRINSGLSTGVLSVTVATAITHGPVYLVGHDLAQDAHDTHWDGAAFAKSEWARGSSQNGKPVMAGYERRMIPGNDGGTVASTAWWDRFRENISYEVLRMTAHGRPVYNVNAHDRVYAVIDGTQAAPLPDPDALSPLGEIVLPPAKPERFAQWAQRARELPADCDRFSTHLGTVREQIAALRRGPAAGWQAHDLVAQLSFEHDSISAGNRKAFAYFLRSAVHNVNADMHWRCRTANGAHARWRMLESIDQAAQAMINALGKLRVDMEGIVRDLA